MFKTIISAVALLMVTQATRAQAPQVGLNPNGTIRYVYFENKGCDTLNFHNEQFSGPSLTLAGKHLPMQRLADNQYGGQVDGLSYSISYITTDDKLALQINCANTGKTSIEGSRLTLNLGINTTMSHYPQWRSAYFPTLFRVEATHLWGYLMSPNGGIITICSPDPIPAYQLYYNNKEKINGFGHGHRIPSFGLDLINPGPLPVRYGATNNGTLKVGEKRSWTILLGATTDLQSVIPTASQDAMAPIVTAALYTIEPNNPISMKIYSPTKPTLEITSPAGKRSSVSVKSSGKDEYTASYGDTSEPGLYTLMAKGGKKVATSSVNVRHAWSDYAKSARRTAIKYQQKGGSHTESWYGLFPAYRAAEIFPESTIDGEVNEKFDEIYPLMHDMVTNLPTSHKNRIQNSALMAALLAQKYLAHGKIEDLHRASSILDFLITQQSKDGAYRNGKVHYTSVIYIAKAFMEVMAVEKELAATSDEWKSNYDRHFSSAKKAIDELTSSLDNIDTEGELTYEDGMISCSYSQISMFALLCPEGSADRLRYTQAAETLARGHRTLSQLLVPDARMNGGSLRYWEAQYDILTFPNMMNSPHGWSAWRIYGLSYLYRLTGKELYLVDMINSLGSCTQLLNPKSDHLNWAFVTDPYLDAELFVEDTANPGKGKYITTILGEQYMPMISDWYRAPKDTWVSGYWGYDGGSCDNDVNEIFKCMGEIALTSCYAHRRDDGSLLLWNCTAQEKEGSTVITPNEECVTTLYTNTDVESPLRNIVRVKR